MLSHLLRKKKEKHPLKIAIERDDAARTSQILACDPESIRRPISVEDDNVSAVEFATSYRRWKSLAVMIEVYKKDSNLAKGCFNRALFHMIYNPSCFNPRIALSMVKLLAGDIHCEVMYKAVLRGNINMIAILCSSPEDLMQTKGLCEQTPMEGYEEMYEDIEENDPKTQAVLDLGIQNVHDGKAMYNHYRFSTARSLLTLFVQAKGENNKKSFFYNMDSAVIESRILPFVTTEIHEYQKTISQRKQYLPNVFNWYREQKPQLQIQFPEEMKSTPGFQERVMAYLRGSPAQSGVVRVYPPEPWQEESEEKSTASSSPPPARDRSPSPSRG